MQFGQVTYLKSTFKTSDFQTISLNTALDKIKNGFFKASIEGFRSLTNSDDQKKQKPFLPSFSFNGCFHDSVINDNFSLSSGLFHFDIDKLDDVNKHKQLIACIPGIVFLFISTSGTGLKGALKISPDEVKNDSDFKRVFGYFETVFLEHGYTIDKACKDVRRLCFVSYDPNIYVNYNAEEIAVPKKVIDQPRPQPKNNQPKHDNRCLNTVIKLLQNAIPGTRHEARLKAGRLAGGYIAGGMIDEREIRAALAQASDRISDKGITSPEENKTIEQAIEYGKLTPIRNYEATNSQLLKWDTPTFKIIPNLYISAFPGVMNSLVKQVLYIANKPQPELTILSALIGMAGSIGGNYSLPDGSRLNLYGVGISGTGTGKDKAMLAGSSIALMAGATMGGQPGSGAALEDMLEERGTKLLLSIDEAAHFIAAMNDQKQTHMASLAGNLLKLFSASRTKYITRRLANSSGNIQKVCENPCVSLLGFACPEKLGEAFGGSSNIDDGLMGRILFATGKDDVKPQRSKTHLHFHHETIELARMIESSRSITIKYSQEADARMDVLIEYFNNSSIVSTNPFEHNLKMRSFEKCERIAGVLAVWDSPGEPKITIEHVNWAEKFINYSDSQVLKFTNSHLHGGKVQSDAKNILKVIDKFKSGEFKQESKHKFIHDSGEFPRSAVLRYSKMAKKDFDAAIDHLIDLEKIISTTKEYFGVNFKVLIHRNNNN